MSAAKIFKKTFSGRSLRKIYNERIKLSGAIGLDRTRPFQLNVKLKGEIEIITTKVKKGNYHFTAYKEKLISKGPGVAPRVISIPTARDRIVLRALCDFLSTVFPEAALNLPQATISSLQSALLSDTYAEYAKLDIEKFYPSLKHEVIFKALKKRIRKPQILFLIKSAIETPTVTAAKGSKGCLPSSIGVPQGLAISNLLAEIALLSLDKDIRNRTDLWYRRYVDDILILAGQEKANGAALEIIKTLADIGLTAHSPNTPGSKSKVADLTNPFTFLGYEISGKTITIRRESILKFEASLASILTAYRHRLVFIKSEEARQSTIDFCRWKLNLRITGCIFRGRRLGWVFYFSQINSTSRLRSVNRTIEQLLKRFGLTNHIRPRSLIKAYYESTRKDKLSHRYVPNFDDMPISEQRKILGILLGEDKIRRISDKRVEELFTMRISAAVRELEEDLSGVS